MPKTAAKFSDCVCWNGCEIQEGFADRNGRSEITDSHRKQTASVGGPGYTGDFPLTVILLKLRDPMVHEDTNHRLLPCSPSGFLLLMLLWVSAFCKASAADWGTLKGRIVYSGAAPARTKLEITRDEDVCGAFGLVDETLVVDEKSRGLANVVIWLSSKEPVPVHPDRQKAADFVELDNKDCRFVPRIALLRTNQTLRCLNSDPVAHNVAVYARRNQPFSIVVPQDKPLERSFPREELQPIRVDCSIHAWMRAHVLITEHPYAAVTRKDGSFEIPGIPQGRWDFRFWHETCGYLKSMDTAEGTLELTRGTRTLEIPAGELNLGEVVVAADQFVSE